MGPLRPCKEKTMATILSSGRRSVGRQLLNCFAGGWREE